VYSLYLTNSFDIRNCDRFACYSRNFWPNLHQKLQHKMDETKEKEEM